MTVREVAKLANVSPATVSRVINEPSLVSPHAIRTVHEAMTRLNYQGKPRGGKARAAAPSDRRTASPLNLFALLIPEIRGGLYVSLQAGFEAQGRKEHRQMLTCSSDNNVDRQGNIILQLMDKHVSGVAIVTAASPTPPYHVHQLQSRGTAVVLLHRPVADVEAPSIVLPFEQIGYRAAREMLQRGHQRIAALFSTRKGSTLHYERGVARAMDEAGLSFEPENPAQAAYIEKWPLEHPDEGLFNNAVAQLFDRPKEERPTAVFCSADATAEKLYFQAADMGLRVPDDFSIVAFGGAQRDNEIAHRLTAVTVDEESVGRQAARMLAEMVCGQRDLHTTEQYTADIGFHEGLTLIDYR